jgi:hypothetical protein
VATLQVVAIEKRKIKNKNKKQKFKKQLVVTNVAAIWPK